MKGYMMTLWVFPPRFCAMVFVAAMVFFAEAPAGAIIACELCLLVRKRETAVEYHVREGVLRVAVSALFFVCVNRAIFLSARLIKDLGAWVLVLVCWWRVRIKRMWPGHPLCAEEPSWFLSKGSQQDLSRSPQQNAGGVWSWVFRTCGIACVEVQWFCFGNVFGNHNDPKVQFTFSNLFGNTFEDLDDFKMYLHFVWFRESIFGSQALRDISLEIPCFD